MTKRQRLQKIVSLLSEKYPAAKTALRHNSPFELLVSTILSAQCTDKRVNMVTPTLFAKYPTAKFMSLASYEDVEEIIRSTGFYKNKAKNIVESSKQIIEKYNGEVPSMMEELTALPGVGRKTANCVMGAYFEIEGVVVDTHVIRIMNLLSICEGTNAEKIEAELMTLLPKKQWVVFTHLIIEHGRAICIARRPKCVECVISKYCDFYNSKK